MTRKQQRIAAIAFVLCGIAAAAGLSLYALRTNVTYFMTPTDLLTHPPSDRTVRLGGMVVYGTVEKTGLSTTFVVTDMQNDVDVIYTGLTPDLFREGKGVVAIGTYNQTGDGAFHATQILAKHDENYMPPDVAKALKRK